MTEQHSEACGSCDRDDCAAGVSRPGETPEQQQQRQELAARMCRIGNKVLVMSGKGGVGKSTVAVNLALALAREGRVVGILDVDLHGPSVPQLLGLNGAVPKGGPRGMQPLEAHGVKVMSVGVLLRSRDEATVWRGPMKMGVIRQLLAEVEWGELDDLIIDCPPGTGDEPLSAAQLIGDVSGVVIVTTPQELAIADVRRSITFCRQLNVPVLGVVENMSGFACPKCGEVVDLLSRGGGERLATEMGVPFLSRLPFRVEVVQAGDAGTPYLAQSPSADIDDTFRNLAQAVVGQAARRRAS